MRFWAIMTLVFLLVPLVSAVGMRVPQELNNGELILKQGDGSEEINFVVVGDSENNTLRFFLEPNETGYISLEGEDRYESTFEIEEYEEVVFDIDFRPEQYTDGDFIKVDYGFAFVEDNNNSTLGFEQVVKKSFLVEVVCRECEDRDEIMRKLNSSSNKNTGGGTGDTSPNNSTSQSLSSSNNENGSDSENKNVRVQDVGSQSEIAEGRVNNERDLPTRLQNAKNAMTSSSPGSGQAANALVFALFLSAFFISGYAYKLTKEVEFDE